MPPWGTRTSATATLLVIADGAVNDNDSNAPTPIANASVFMSATIIAGHSQRGSAEAPFNCRHSNARYTQFGDEPSPRTDGRARGGQLTRCVAGLSDHV